MSIQRNTQPYPQGTEELKGYTLEMTNKIRGNILALMFCQVLSRIDQSVSLFSQSKKKALRPKNVTANSVFFF